MKNYNTKKTNSWEKFGNIKKLVKDDFIKVCEQSNSMSEACAKLGLNFTTFTKYAKIYECYKPNQCGKGINKNILSRKWDLKRWEKDENIIISRASLRKYIFILKLFPIECNKCKLKEWLGKEILLELNHINGIGYDNRKSNIELLCPNCHAQTLTFRGRNKK